MTRHLYAKLVDLPASQIYKCKALEAFLIAHDIHFRTRPIHPFGRRYSVPTVDLCCAQSVLPALEGVEVSSPQSSAGPSGDGLDKASTTDAAQAEE